MTNDAGLLPAEYNVIIKLDEPKQGGAIWVPPSKRERDELEMDEGTLIAISPVAFNYAEWPDGSRRPQVGDRVLFARYQGAIIERNGAKFRVLKDSAIIAVVEVETPGLAAVA